MIVKIQKLMGGGWGAPGQFFPNEEALARAIANYLNAGLSVELHD